jgi:paraquat-inducible protein A
MGMKLATLAWLWFAPTAEATRRRVLQGLEALGKWSMLDVFIVAIVIVAVKFGWMSKAHAESGVYVFAASIFLSMAVSMWVDRLSKR